jgi:prepilin-type N-terminal cleavage/methylation domain-containing protein
MTAGRKQGFSLIEILVVLAVLGILLGMSGLFLNSYLQRQRLNEATRTLGESLRRASETAVTSSEEVVATISNTEIRWVDESNKVGVQSLPTGATIPGTPIIVTFSGRGLPQLGQPFKVQLNGKERNLYLLPTGAVMYQ